MKDANKLKINLIHYFVKVEKYKAIKEYSNDYISYLVNKKNPYKIIRLTIGLPVSIDNNLNEIKNSLKISKREKIKILNVALTDQSLDYSLEGTTLLIDSLNDAKSKLRPTFPKIYSLEEEAEEEENIEEDLMEVLRDPSKSRNLKFKKAVQSMQKNSLISIILLLIFFVMPIVTFILSIMWFGNFISGYTIDLFFGATNRNLTINGLQFWRIFTYGFTVGNSGIFAMIITILIISGNAIRLSKYTENIVGSFKFALSIFITYPLVGLFVSSGMPSQNAIFSGPIGFLASVVGILGVTTWDKKNATIQIFSKNRLVFPIILLIFYPLIVRQNHLYVLIIASAACGASIYMLANWRKTNLGKLSFIPITIILLLCVAPLCFIFLDFYSPAHDINSRNAIILYVKKHLLSVDQANNIFKLNGWNWFIDGEKLTSWI